MQRRATKLSAYLENTPLREKTSARLLLHVKIFLKDLNYKKLEKEEREKKKERKGRNK